MLYLTLKTRDSKQSSRPSVPELIHDRSS